MNNKQKFHHIKFSIVGGGNSFAQEIRWKSKLEITAEKRRKQNAKFTQCQVDLKEPQRNAGAGFAYRECKGVVK